MEKENPTNWEFVVDKKLKDLYQRKNFGFYINESGKMPVNFIANTHTTGGNSGSPVLNARGELVGINFDRKLGRHHRRYSISRQLPTLDNYRHTIYTFYHR